MAPKVLFVLTSHDKLGETGKPTGWYLVSSSSPLPQIRLSRTATPTPLQALLLISFFSPA